MHHCGLKSLWLKIPISGYHGDMFQLSAQRIWRELPN